MRKIAFYNITRTQAKEVLRPGLEGTNPGISINPLVAILINGRFVAEGPELETRGGVSPGTPKIKNDRGEIAAKDENQVVFRRIPLISVILCRPDPVPQFQLDVEDRLASILPERDEE